MTTGPHDSEPSGQALPQGTRIEEFIIERVLGSGGFGITYLARDTGLNRQVVIKENLPAQFAWRDPASGTVRPRHTTTGDRDDFEWSLTNFLREAETLASLDHPGIVRVLRKFEANGTAYFVMPFVEGVAFDELIESRRAKGQVFSEEELGGLLDRMLHALGYLHARGIYHRDIKPGNILISNEGVPALIDFGSARQRLSERSMTVVESAGYTPFEQLQSRGNVGPWSDLFALGATLVKAITFEAPPKAADRIGDDPMVPLASRKPLAGIYSPVLLTSIDRALAVNVKARWQSAEEWRAGLAAVSAARVGEWELKNRMAAVAQSPAWEEDHAGAIPVLPQPESASVQEPLTVPALWNPSSAVNWSMLFTPAFGAFMHARNAKALGYPAVEKLNMRFFYGMVIASFLGLFLVDYRIGLGVAYVILIVWYYALAKKQIAFVKLRFGKAYPKKSFTKPLLLGFGCLFVAVMFVKGVHSTFKEAKAEERAKENAEACMNKGMSYYLGQGVAKDYVEAVKWYRKAADQGDAGAQCYLGICYHNGEGVVEDKAEAARWFKTAADAGDPGGMWRLGVCCLFGTGVTKDERVAAVWFRKASDTGDSEGMWRLGELYRLGTGITKDEQEAAAWYRKAADAGSAEGMSKLGYCFQSGTGLTKDERKAVEWFRKSAEAANYEGMWNLGLCYQLGTGVTKDEREAAAWYLKAADAGNPEGMLNLGLCYQYGTGVAKDEREAAAWYRKAADAGQSEGMCSLGELYQYGIGVTKDEKEAAAWYRKAAEQGNSKAQKNLGLCYIRGEGVAKNAAEAVKLWRMSAEQGEADAQFFLGLSFANGEGVTKDPVEAVKWYRKAAEQGLAGAQCYLGICYGNGDGVTKDPAEAVNWYRKAAEQGNTMAQANLGLCLYNGEGVSKDPTEAAKLWRKAADQGDAAAQCNLGVCYANGEGVVKDPAEAVKWYRKAADQGHEQAKKNLEAATRRASSVPTAEPRKIRLGAANITEKLRRIIIPRIDFDDTTLEESIDFLRLRAAELDTLEADPAKKGTNFVINRPRTAGAGDARVRELRIRNVPLAVALKYICEQTGFRYKVDDFAVTLEPIKP
jgi:TPR repeat protein/serine/threonine protein kinase